MPRNFLFSSESVSEGHPDKVCDQISDAILDAALVAAGDERARRRVRAACETMVKNNRVVLGGEISSARLDYEKIVRDVVNGIGYNRDELGFNGGTCRVENYIGEQSPDIAQGVDRDERKNQGAGDQGMMFGYACSETEELMPAPIFYAHQLMRRHAELRRAEKFPWLRPDAKAQLSVRYEGDAPVAVETVVLSTQHDESVTQQRIKEAVVEEIIKPVLAEKWPGGKSRYLINPTGKFVIGGPVGDCGLTGRKIIVDTYGGSARHGGGAFSGKDPSKVDRSAAYAMRYVAKNIVAAGLAARCEVQIAYAIGKAEPVSLMVETFGTAHKKLNGRRIEQLVRAHFKLAPADITDSLDLLRPIYRETAAHGHFGRVGFPWEKTDQADALRDAAGL